MSSLLIIPTINNEIVINIIVGIKKYSLPNINKHMIDEQIPITTKI